MTSLKTLSIQKNNGQGLIETVMILPVFLIIIFSIAGISYQIVVYNWSEHALHESLICLDSGTSYECEKNLKNQIKKILLFEENFTTYLAKNHTDGIGKISIYWPEKNFVVINKNIQLNHKINLPLHENIQQ